MPERRPSDFGLAFLIGLGVVAVIVIVSLLLRL
jgi:hypothetical protein